MRMRPTLPVYEAGMTDGDRERFSKLVSFVVMKNASASATAAGERVEAGLVGAALYEDTLKRFSVSKALLGLAATAREQGYGAVLSRLVNVDLTKQVLPRRERAPHMADIPEAVPADHAVMRGLVDHLLADKDGYPAGVAGERATETLQAVVFAASLDGNRYMVSFASWMSDTVARTGSDGLNDTLDRFDTRPSVALRP